MSLSFMKPLNLSLELETKGFLFDIPFYQRLLAESMDSDGAAFVFLKCSLFH